MIVKNIATRQRSTQKSTLTDSLVKKLEPHEKQYEIRDGALKGFYVRVYPSGTKTYRCEYKKNKHYVIGRSTVLSATQARQQAKEIMLLASKGLDPKEEEKRRKADEISKQKNKITFKEFLDGTYKTYYQYTYPKTAKEAIRSLECNFLADFGHLTLKEITKSRILSWRIERQKMTRKRIISGEAKNVPISPATVNRNIEQLSAVFSHAIVHGYIKENPTKGIEKLAAPEHKVRFLSREEYQRLLVSLDERKIEKVETRDRANKRRAKRGWPLLPDLKKVTFADYLKPMVLLALSSGIRFGSLCRLEWDKHIDFSHDNVIISLTTDIVKTGKPYDVPLDEETSKVIKLWYEQTETTHHGKGWVFPGKKPGTHITSVKRAWNNLKKRAKIENFTWHDQRHDFASQHVMSGTGLYTVMELLGHSDPKTTKKYAHLAVEHKITVAKQLAKRRSELLKEK